ncbi:hypothetical protein AOQ84DRAFT_402249, partial [Glonium stellatum]
MQLRKTIKKPRRYHDGGWETLPASDFESKAASLTDTTAPASQSPTANPPSRVHRSRPTVPSSDHIDVAQHRRNASGPKNMTNVKRPPRDKSTHSVNLRRPPIGRTHEKVGEKSAARPVREYTRRPAAFPTLPFSRINDIDDGQGKEQPHGIGKLMRERFSGNTVKWKKCVDHLSTRSPLISFPPGLSEEEKDDLEKLQSSMDTSEEEETEELISFHSLYLSLRAEIIDQIYGESNGLYFDGYYPVKCLLNLDEKTLEAIMKENSAIWDNPPHHILGIKARNPSQVIDPDTPPPGAIRYAFKFLRQEGLPASLLGQWGHLLRETEVTFCESEQGSTDQTNETRGEEEAPGIQQSVILEQLQQTEHLDNIIVGNKHIPDRHVLMSQLQQQQPSHVQVVPSVPAQTLPNRLPDGDLNHGYLPKPPLSRPMPRYTDLRYDNLMDVHHDLLRDVGIYPPGSAQRAISVERNILNSAQHNHGSISTSMMEPRKRGPAPVAPMAPMKHVTPYIGPLPGRIMEEPQKDQPKPTAPGQVYHAPRQNDADMLLQTFLNWPPSTGTTPEPVLRPSQVPSTPLERVNIVVKTNPPTISHTPTQDKLSPQKSPPKPNSNPISRPNLIGFPSKQALSSPSKISPGKSSGRSPGKRQMLAQNKNCDLTQVFGPPLGGPTQEIYPQARSQHLNLLQAEFAALNHSLQSSQQGQHSQNRPRDLDCSISLKQQLDPQRLETPPSQPPNLHSPGTQDQDLRTYQAPSPYQSPAQHLIIKQSHNPLPPYPYYPAGHSSDPLSKAESRPQPEPQLLLQPQPQSQTQPAITSRKAVRKTPVPPPPNVSTLSGHLETPPPKPHHHQVTTTATTVLNTLTLEPTSVPAATPTPALASTLVPASTPTSAPAPSPTLARTPAAPTPSTPSTDPPALPKNIDSRIIFTPHASALNARLKQAYAAQERDVTANSGSGNNSSSSGSTSNPSIPGTPSPANLRLIPAAAAATVVATTTAAATATTTTTTTTTATAARSRFSDADRAGERDRDRAKQRADTSNEPASRPDARDPDASDPNPATDPGSNPDPDPAPDPDSNPSPSPSPS